MALSLLISFIQYNVATEDFILKTTQHYSLVHVHDVDASPSASSSISTSLSSPPRAPEAVSVDEEKIGIGTGSLSEITSVFGYCLAILHLSMSINFLQG